MAKKALVAIADRNDVSHLRLNTRLPVRIDAGSYDAVAPLPLVRGLADAYRRDGVRVSFSVHPTGHTPVPLDAATAAISRGGWRVPYRPITRATHDRADGEYSVAGRSQCCGAHHAMQTFM